jgi:glycosyltransferase involved in cell wall biosynthesis
MKIIFVTPEFLVKNRPSTGLPNYLYKVSKALIQFLHTPIIVTAGEKDEHTFYDGIEVYRKAIILSNTQKPVLDYIMNSIQMNYILNKKVTELCKTTKIDLVQYASLFGLGLFHKVNIPAIMRLSSYAKVSFQTNSQNYSKTLVQVMTFIEKLASKKMVGIISPSNIMADAFSNDIKRKVQVIETPYVNDIIETNNDIYNKILKNKKYILYFGILSEEKGVFNIVDIIPSILNRYPDYHFVFVGKPILYNGRSSVNIIKDKTIDYKDNITFLSPLTHESLYPIIEHATLVILPSWMENLSNACIESMNFKKVVIGTAGASFEQLIEDGISGFLAKPNNSASLLKTVERAITLSEKDKMIIGENAKQRINKLAPEVVVKKLIRYYKYILKI